VKAYAPIDTTELGMTICSKPVHKEKPYELIAVTLFEIVTDSSPVQALNASDPIVLTQSGTV